MKNFPKLIEEIDSTLTEIIIFESLIHTILIFLIIYLFLSLVNLFPILAAIPAVVYFFASTYVKMGRNKMRAVENKYKPLREKLRTAADNIKMENPVVDELQNEVMREMKNVSISQFLKTKNISYKVLASILLSFIIVYISTFNVQVLDINNIFNTFPELFENIQGRKSENEVVEVNTTDNIYGESSLAVLGNKEINIKIQPVNFEVSIREEGEIQQKKFSEIFPSEVELESATALEEMEKTLEEQEIIKSYFRGLATG